MLWISGWPCEVKRTGNESGGLKDICRRVGPVLVQCSTVQYSTVVEIVVDLVEMGVEEG